MLHKRVSVAATGTHIYRRPSDALQGRPGPRCRCCNQQWLNGTRFCLDAECTTALEQGAVRDEIDAPPAGEREERLQSRYGLQSGDMVRPGDMIAKRPKVVLRSAPAVLAQAGAKGSGPFSRTFSSAAASSTQTKAAPSGGGKGGGKCKPGNKMCHKLRNRAIKGGHSGHAQRYDLDPEYRLNMQASGYERDLYFDDGEAVG